MRRWWVVVLLCLIAGGVAIAFRSELRGTRSAARPRPVPAGDREIAWLHTPTSFDTWENFVWGVKRAEMANDGGPDGIEVNDSGAFPDKTTSVPEVVIRRKGFAGAIRVRWYKITDSATQEDWVKALARNSVSPLAIQGGWSSDRAKNLADAMHEANWTGSRPLLFLSTATADKLDPDEEDLARGNPGPNLISVYDRSYRFCFTNRQMADSVTDFVLSDPTLRPGPIVWPGFWALSASAAGPWTGLAALGAESFPDPEPVPAHAIQWRDDPYSTDLSFKFRESLQRANFYPGMPHLAVTTHSVPFTTGRLTRPNPAEAQVVEHILANLPEPGTRSILVIPTVTAPSRRTLRALTQGNSKIGRQLVAVTGDGMGINTFFRDREHAWPVRSISIPLVLFTHADPFGWDTPGQKSAPPPGYELVAPTPGVNRSSTEDIRLYTRLTRVVAAAAFPDGGTSLVDSPDTMGERLHSLKPAFFDPSGDRVSGSGEHVVVLRPIFNPETQKGKAPVDGILEVYARQPGQPGWVRVHTRPLDHPDGGPRE